MLRIVLAIISLLAASCTAEENANNFGGPRARSAETYVVNLDIDPQKRWENVSSLFDPKYIEDGFTELTEKKIPPHLLQLLSYMSTDVKRFFPSPYAEEMQGLSKMSGVSIETLVQINVLYEAAAYAASPLQKVCTSIVTKDKDGNLLHGRNLDFASPSFLRSIFFNIDFQRGGKTEYFGMTIFGYVGLITGVRPDAFSFTVNQRNEGTLFQNVVAAIKGASPTPFNVRNILDKCTSFKQAIRAALTNPTIAPVYYTIAGVEPDDAAIVTRNAQTLANVVFMGQQHESWFLLETNFDWWKEAGDNRRATAIKAMNRVGQKRMTPKNLYKVLSTEPVFNHWTIHTVLMTARNASAFTNNIRFDAPEESAEAKLSNNKKPANDFQEQFLLNTLSKVN